MPLKDLSGKKAIDLDREDFEKLFCQHCLEYQECDRSDQKITRLQGFRGHWTMGYSLSEAARFITE